MDRAQDRKAMAAGEEREERENGQEKNLEYAEEVLDTLLRFSSPAPDSKQWGEDEWTAWRRDWIRRISGVPHWKLLRLGEFTSPWINDVWAFFDGLKTAPINTYEAPKKLPAPQSKIAKDCNALITKLFSIEFRPTRHHNFFPVQYLKERGEWVNKRRAIEKQELEKLHQKYPRAGFDKVITIRGL